MTERNQCFFDQCEANNVDTVFPEPSERRYLVPVDQPAGWFWFCVECAEQIDAEAKAADDYEEWNSGFNHLTGERI